MKRVKIIEFGEGLENLPQLLGECLLGKLDFPKVECTDTTDFEPCSNLCRQLSLCPRENNVKELLGSGDWSDGFPSLRRTKVSKLPQ